HVRLWLSITSPTLLPSLIFFFCWSAHAATPLSFPTRRSSDLARIRDRSQHLGGCGFCIGRWNDALVLIEAAPSIEPVPVFDRVKDRKSTRLNSSHVAISYAVFCLKKKTQPTTSSVSCAAGPGC